jgi:hypothetical protein
MGEARRRRKARTDSEPLELDYLGRMRVIAHEPDIIVMHGQTVTIAPTIEVTPVFVSDCMRNPDSANYAKLAASHGACVATRLLGVPAAIGLTARIAILRDGGRASFPALLLDDGRVICWRGSDQTPDDIAASPRARITDRPARAAEMRSLIELHSPPCADDRLHDRDPDEPHVINLLSDGLDRMQAGGFAGEGEGGGFWWKALIVYDRLLTDMRVHAYHCAYCPDGGFEPGDKPEAVSLRITPGPNTMHIMPVCEACIPAGLKAEGTMQ